MCLNTFDRILISDLEDSHVIPGLIHKCYLAKSRQHFYQETLLNDLLS